MHSVVSSAAGGKLALLWLMLCIHINILVCVTWSRLFNLPYSMQYDYHTVTHYQA